MNHFAVENIARICNQIGCWLIHFSTDYVFDGDVVRLTKRTLNKSIEHLWSHEARRGSA